MPSGSLGERRTGNTDVHALEHADQAALRDFRRQSEEDCTAPLLRSSEDLDRVNDSATRPHAQRQRSAETGNPAGLLSRSRNQWFQVGAAPARECLAERASALIESHKAPGIGSNRRRRDPNPTLAVTSYPHKSRKRSSFEEHALS